MWLGSRSGKGRPHASWKLGGGARSFAVTATLFLSAACSGTATERLAGTSTPTPSAAASGATTLEGHIVGDSDRPGYTVEIPDGWSTEDGGFIVKEEPDALGLSVWDVGDVPRHPCRWQGTETEPGQTVDDLAEVLTSQRLRDATAPSEVTLAGHEGLYLEWSVPDDWIVTGDSAFQGCDDAGDFVSWWGRTQASGTNRSPARSTVCGSFTSRDRHCSSMRRTHSTRPPPTARSWSTSWPRCGSSRSSASRARQGVEDLGGEPEGPGLVNTRSRSRPNWPVPDGTPETPQMRSEVQRRWSAHCVSLP